MEHIIDTRHGVFVYRVLEKPIQHIYLRLQPDGVFDLSVPRHTSAQQRETVLQEKSAWMARVLAQQRAAQAQHPAFGYQSGQTFYLQGTPYRFLCLQGDPARIWLRGDCLYLRQMDISPERTRRFLMQWEKQQVQQIYARIHAQLWPFFAVRGAQLPRIQWRVMRSRWGSCSKQKGRISLNLRLLCVPFACFTYVVAHEYCHLLQPNHGPVFYQELAHCLPDYREYETQLKEWAFVLNIS